jgi:hypothetical protein
MDPYNQLVDQHGFFVRPRLQLMYVEYRFLGDQKVHEVEGDRDPQLLERQLLRERELQVRERELQVRERELQVRERELQIKERELGIVPGKSEEDFVEVEVSMSDLNLAGEVAQETSNNS